MTGNSDEDLMRFRPDKHMAKTIVQDNERQGLQYLDSNWI